MLTKIAIVLVVALAALVVLIATRPAEFRIARARTVSAPPAVVHATLNDFHWWSEWSPWEKRGPALKREFSGASAGPGAVYAWVGNKEVGEGRMTITEHATRRRASPSAWSSSSPLRPRTWRGSTSHRADRGRT